MNRWYRPVLMLFVFVVVLCGFVFETCGEGYDGNELIAAEGPEVKEALVPLTSLEGTLRIAGGTAHLGVMEDAKRNIIQVNSNIQIMVEGGGSGVGVKKVGEGLVDIGNTGRAVSDEEREKYGLVSFAFAVDGVTVVVHPDNHVKALSTEQVKKIFAGDITNWKDVGGTDSSINLYNRDKESGTRKVFWKKCLGKGDMSENSNFVKSNGAMKTAVSNDPSGIGYLSIGYVDETVNAVTLDGIEPTQENAKEGTFKVTRKLYMNTKGEPTGLTRAFIDYIMSRDGAEIVRSKGYIPINKK